MTQASAVFGLRDRDARVTQDELRRETNATEEEISALVRSGIGPRTPYEQRSR